MTAMELLFAGQIYPCEKIAPRDPVYRETCQKSEEILAGLSGKLEKEEYEIVEQLERNEAVAADILARESFKYGLSLGLQLMQEAYELPYFTLNDDKKDQYR